MPPTVILSGVQCCVDVQTVTVVKAGGPLGLSIVGGQGHTSHPFGLDNPGVFISKVNLTPWCLILSLQLATSAWQHSIC